MASGGSSVNSNNKHCGGNSYNNHGPGKTSSMIGVRRLLAAVAVGIAYYFLGMTFKAIVVVGVLALIVIFLVLPSIFHWSKTVQRHMIFLPWVKWPKHVNFDEPEINGTVNFYLPSTDGTKIGVWHVLPKSLVEEGRDKDAEWYRASLGRAAADGHPVVVYMHGNTASRARDHRIEMYRVLRNLDFHVVAFDYRGYADSSPVVPTKKGVVEDGHTVISYVRANAGAGAPIVVWGHSLGSAVSAAVVAEMADSGMDMPMALVLESPFNNIRDEIRVHPMSYLWRKMPFFSWFFTGSLNRSDVAFLTDECVKRIHLPILMLHAEDDAVIPYELGGKLYWAARHSRVEGLSRPLLYVLFKEERGYGHVYIYDAPELPERVAKFVDKSIKDSWTEEDYTGKPKWLYESP